MCDGRGGEGRGGEGREGDFMSLGRIKCYSNQ